MASFRFVARLEKQCTSTKDRRGLKPHLCAKKALNSGFKTKTPCSAPTPLPGRDVAAQAVYCSRFLRDYSFILKERIICTPK